MAASPAAPRPTSPARARIRIDDQTWAVTSSDPARPPYKVTYIGGAWCCKDEHGLLCPGFKFRGACIHTTSCALDLAPAPAPRVPRPFACITCGQAPAAGPTQLECLTCLNHRRDAQADLVVVEHAATAILAPVPTCSCVRCNQPYAFSEEPWIARLYCPSCRQQPVSLVARAALAN